jgi:hypothetical protein
VRASIELLAKLVIEQPDGSAAQLVNVELDDQITEALSQLRMYELPVGKQLTSGVEDAQLVPD